MSLRVHRATYEPRVELTPLLDVIFLLLTFFIYSLVLTVRAQILPVTLPNLSTAQISAERDIAGITVDDLGRVYLNQQPISLDVLRVRLKEMAEMSDPPAIFLAPDIGAASVDRLPVFIQLIDLIRETGLERVNIVGQPKSQPPRPATPPATP